MAYYLKELKHIYQNQDPTIIWSLFDLATNHSITIFQLYTKLCSYHSWNY